MICERDTSCLWAQITVRKSIEVLNLAAENRYANLSNSANSCCQNKKINETFYKLQEI